MFPKIDSLFERWNKDNSPGCCLGIIRDGEFLYKKGFGMGDLVKKMPITSKSIFEIASVSKQFTAACIALLHLRKEISIEDLLNDYFPELNFNPEIKIKHLIYHESGIKDFIYHLILLNYSWEFIESLSEDNLLDFIKETTDLDFAPGCQHNYSNTNYFLLGQIIKKVTGKSLKKFAKDELFSPLQMKDTSFEDNFGEITNYKASGYTPQEENFKENIPKAKIMGPRGVYTTIDDLFLWDQNFYAKKIGGQDFIDLLQKPSRDMISGLSTKRWNDSTKNQGYAFGLLTDFYRGLKTIRHGGDFAGFTSEMMRFPEKKLTIIILSNNSNINPTTLGFRVADILLENEVTIPSPYVKNKFQPLSHNMIDSLIGTYYKSEYNAFYSIFKENNKLFLANDWMKSELKAISADSYNATRIESLMLVRKKEKAIIIETEYFTAEIPKITPFEICEKYLAEYSSNYSNEQSKQQLHITIKKGKLSFRLQIGEQQFRPIMQDVFTNGFLQLKFHRMNNKISFVCLNSAGAREIIYKKN